MIYAGTLIFFADTIAEGKQRNATISYLDRTYVHFDTAPSDRRGDPEQVKRDGWIKQHLAAISLDEHQLTWPERELVRQIGERLYGELSAVWEMRHGR